MKKSICLFLLSICFFICSACSKDDADNPIIGNWKLTSWSIEIPFDLNRDATFSTNLLDETNCEVNEILRFDNHGLVTSTNTFNPGLNVSLKDDTFDSYMATETCAQGSIGFATEYKFLNDQNVSFNEVIALITGTKLTVVYKKAMKIYNEAGTEVIDTKDLTLVYEKK